MSRYQDQTRSAGEGRQSQPSVSSLGLTEQELGVCRLQTHSRRGRTWRTWLIGEPTKKVSASVSNAPGLSPVSAVFLLVEEAS